MAEDFTPWRASRAVFADPKLPHQIVLRFAGQFIVVSCNCLRVRAAGVGQAHYEPLGSRTRWDPAEPIGLWRAHMEQVSPGA